jgi:hypothetical protein
MAQADADEPVEDRLLGAVRGGSKVSTGAPVVGSSAKVAGGRMSRPASKATANVVSLTTYVTSAIIAQPDPEELSADAPVGPLGA